MAGTPFGFRKDSIKNEEDAKSEFGKPQNTGVTQSNSPPLKRGVFRAKAEAGLFKLE